MPALPSKQLVNATTDAFADSGAAARLISAGRQHPRKFAVTYGQTSFAVWVYLWTLTHGGGPRSPDEFRIQLTSVSPPLPLNPDGPTLLLGYEPNTKCFAGFDLEKHKAFSTQSPSIQININTLRDALRDGFAFTRKGNDEIAVAFRPDNMLAYSLNAADLHQGGADEAVSTLLVKASRFEPITSDEIELLSKKRQRVVTTVSKLARESHFRRTITVAYDHRCCVTGLQLKLVDAAHILPVGAEGSVDRVTNGLCLSPTYHRAYDNGLIFLSEDREMLINPSKRTELVALGLGGGLDDLERHLGREILLPPDRNQWPDPTFIRAANQHRNL